MGNRRVLRFCSNWKTEGKQLLTWPHMAMGEQFSLFRWEFLESRFVFGSKLLLTPNCSEWILLKYPSNLKVSDSHWK